MKLVLFIAVMSSCAARSQDADNGGFARGTLNRETLLAVLHELRTNHDVPALAAAIVTEEGPMLIEVIGVRKKGDETKAERNDMFHLGSCTKAFTGWLAGWAVEERKLRWDSTLAEVFARQSRKWPDTHKRITLGHLLTHHSGLTGGLPPGHWPRQSKPKVNGRETKRQRLQLVEAVGGIALASEPGSTDSYCNNNQLLAAAMVEKVAGKSWESLIEELIFRPLGMNEVGQGPMGRPGRIEQPWPHTEFGAPREPEPQADNPEVVGPSGRLHMSMDSWSRFAAEILRGSRGRGRLLRAATYKELVGPPGYSKGCWLTHEVNEHGQALALSHGGSNNLNSALAFVYPPENLAILVATNMGSSGSETPGSKVCLELVLRLIDMCRQQEAGPPLQ